MINILPALGTALEIATKVASTAGAVKAITDSFDDSKNTSVSTVPTVQQSTPAVVEKKVEVVEKERINQYPPVVINFNVYIDGNKKIGIGNGSEPIYLISDLNNK